MTRGKIEHIWQNDLPDGRTYLSLTIEGEKYSLWDKKYFDKLKEGQVVDFEFKRSGDYNNITEIDIDSFMNFPEQQERKSNPHPNQKDQQIMKMSCLKSACYLVRDVCSDIDRKVDLTLDVARQFEKYLTGELEEPEN